MPRLSFSAYLAHLAEESQRFRAALSTTSPTTPVPSCPDWSAADLLWHLTGVQRFWAHVVEHRPDRPNDSAEPTRPEGYGSLLHAFDAATLALTKALRGADPSEPAWSWDDEQTVGFTFRRQALEALVHRVDAEQIQGSVGDIDPSLAADGVDEVLSVFYGGAPQWATTTPGPYVVQVRLSDTGHSTFVRPGTFAGTSPNSGRRYDGEPMLEVLAESAPPDATISAGASDVLLWIWKRTDASRITRKGDPAAVADFVAAVSAPLD